MRNVAHSVRWKGGLYYTDPGPFAGAELASFSPGTLGRGRAKALTDESDVGSQSHYCPAPVAAPPDNGPPLDITALLTRAGPATYSVTWAVRDLTHEAI